jgi:hypothetical protein
MNIDYLKKSVLEFDNYTLAWYPSIKEMWIEFYDSIDDDDYELCIWNADGFHVEESPEKDVDLLAKQLQFFEQYGG